MPIVNRVTANAISDLMVEFAARLDKSVLEVQLASPAEEFSRYRAAVARIMGEMLLEIMNPIYDEHPDLRPKELD